MLLITPIEVMQIAFGNDIELDSSTIRPSKIDIAQEHFLRSKIGDTLFDNFANGQNPDFVDLYLKPPLAYYVKYGLLDELAVVVDRSGVIVMLGNNTKLQSNTESKADKNTTATDTQSQSTNSSTQGESQKTANDTTTLSQKAYHDDVDEETSNRTETVLPATGSTSTTTIATERSLFISKNLEANDKKIVDATDSTTSSTSQNSDSNSEIQKQSSQTDLGNSTRNDTSESSQFRPASPIQIQALKSRALTDANILMRKALRYIESNSDLFPDFARQQHTVF